MMEPRFDFWGIHDNSPRVDAISFSSLSIYGQTIAQTASSKPTTISSPHAARLGTSSPQSPTSSHQSECGSGRMQVSCEGRWYQHTLTDAPRPNAQEMKGCATVVLASWRRSWPATVQIWFPSAPTAQGHFCTSATASGRTPHFSVPTRVLVAAGTKNSGPTPQISPLSVAFEGKMNKLRTTWPKPAWCLG